MATSGSQNGSKKRVIITAPAGAPGRPMGPRQRSMGPRGQSLKAFTPDNYSDDEDDAVLHDENRDVGVAGAGAGAGAAGEASSPGAGWTNGQVPPQFTPAVTLHPYTRKGRLALYNHHRRWINFQSSWSRIGAGATEMDAVHSSSSGGASVLSGCRQEEGAAVRALVAQLCEAFYRAGWATGTGGGVSIRVGGPDEGRPSRVFVAPSGVQKEDLVGDDVFELDMEQRVVAPPKTPGLRLSACTPLWYTVYALVPSARCVIHTHSMHAQMATLLDPTERAPALRVTHLEMLKGVGNHAYDGVLELPIIDNRPSEDLLADQMAAAIRRYPKCNAVLVRRHGIYVWGDSWEQAKAQCESFDYLCESAVKMKAMGMDCGLAPLHGTYHVEDEGAAGEEKKEDGAAAPPRKRPRDAALPPGPAAPAPLLPRDARLLLLDADVAAGAGPNGLRPYADVGPALRWCRDQGVAVHVRGRNGKVPALGAQAEGDLASCLAEHLAATGGAPAPAGAGAVGYGVIAEELGAAPGDVVFVGGREDEVAAAGAAGMRAVAAVRPGIASLSDDAREKFPAVRSLLQLCGAD